MKLFFVWLLFTTFHSLAYGDPKLTFGGGGGGGGILSLFKLTHDWNSQKETRCPENEYAIGASIQTSVVPGSEVTSISAVRLRCSDRIRGKSDSSSIHVGKYYKETSDWHEVKECPQGFVVGIVLYVKPRPNSEEMDTGSYTSGIKLICQGEHSPRPSVLLGTTSTQEAATTCSNGQAVNEVGVKLKSVITFDEGEALFPSVLMIKCALIVHPFVKCSIELEFEPVSNFNCSPCVQREYSLVALMENSTLGTDADNITCHFSTFTGPMLNADITNLNEIVYAYDSEAIDEDWMSYLIFSKTEEVEFQEEWDNVVGKDEPRLHPNQIMHTFRQLSEVKDNFTLHNASPRKTMTFANLAEFRANNKATDQPDIEITHSVEIKQLVGYCSVLKLYFPIVKKRVFAFMKEKEGKHDTIIEFV